jgi:D-alanyl-D-alanine carboxypeptidase
MAAVFFACTAGSCTAGCRADRFIHPGFSITNKMLTDAIKDFPDDRIRLKICTWPKEFLQSMELLLADDQEIYLLVDKNHALEKTFAPSDLIGLDNYAVEKTKQDMYLRKIVIASLQKMTLAAKKENITLTVSSAFRSYSYQETVYAGWVKLLGEEQASKESARAGHSQHQLGTAVDFNPIDDSFADTPACAWLAMNAAAYGFSLSYPAGYETATGYKYEPWHYRYLGSTACEVIETYFSGVQQSFLEFYYQYAGFFKEHIRKSK